MSDETNRALEEARTEITDRLTLLFKASEIEAQATEGLPNDHMFAHGRCDGLDTARDVVELCIDRRMTKGGTLEIAEDNA